MPGSLSALGSRKASVCVSTASPQSPSWPTVESPQSLNGNDRAAIVDPYNMPSNSSSVQQGRGHAPASNDGCQGLSFTTPSGTLPTTLECHVRRQATLAKQTPYERKHSGFSPGDTGILLGQTDFQATLNRPGVKRFASVRLPTREEQLSRNASSGIGNKTWDKIRSWGKITFGKGKRGDSKKPNVENGQTGRCQSDEIGQDAAQDRETGRVLPQQRAGRRYLVSPRNSLVTVAAAS
ncbi:hypothetical protein, conserved [Eimeria maxima]|uniref:Uncharacterized protein n=1 Tax=Eimeria maxima TaxID=5804 RepID=U6MCV2_EIMMA|nr:hypothetical protein, conserved [Eimeria maxima]CDJ61861.1 hypothetical protein, conserved [Eimeria maxima]